MHRRLFLTLATAVSAAVTGMATRRASAEPMPRFTFPSIDGGLLDSADWQGKPVLVVNTASLCGFAGQLRDMQAMHEKYAAQGLIVVAVPSNDFNQELDDGKKVKEYCTLEYGITLPMTDILHVAKGEVHPFYQWVRQQTGFVPKWNFSKVLLDPQGRILGTWGSFTKPDGPQIHDALAPYLSA